VSEAAYIELNDGADDRLSQLADEVSRTGGRVVLTRNGKPLLVAMEVVPGFVEVEVAVPRLIPALR